MLLFLLQPRMLQTILAHYTGYQPVDRVTGSSAVAWRAKQGSGEDRTASKPKAISQNVLEGEPKQGGGVPQLVLPPPPTHTHTHRDRNAANKEGKVGGQQRHPRDMAPKKQPQPPPTPTKQYPSNLSPKGYWAGSEPASGAQLHADGAQFCPEGREHCAVTLMRGPQRAGPARTHQRGTWRHGSHVDGCGGTAAGRGHV